MGEMQKILTKLIENNEVKNAIDRSKHDFVSNGVFENYFMARDVVICQIMKESEGLVAQLRSFQRSLGDVVVAMKFTSEDVYKQVVGLPCSSLSGGGGVFTADHALSIQR